jgi:hypothetical protein
MTIGIARTPLLPLLSITLAARRGAASAIEAGDDHEKK